MPDVSKFIQQRATDLQTAQHMLYVSWKRKSFPRLHELSPGSIVTPLCTALVVQFLIILLNAKGRRRTCEIVEAVLATFLMICLLLAVIGMPIGMHTVFLELLQRPSVNLISMRTLQVLSIWY